MSCPYFEDEKGVEIILFNVEGTKVDYLMRFSNTWQHDKGWEFEGLTLDSKMGEFNVQVLIRAKGLRTSLQA